VSRHPLRAELDPLESGDAFDAFEATAVGADIDVEILGPHLRINGKINVGRFKRLSDMVNQTVGYLHLTDAHLLHRSGDPTGFTLPELFVSRDEITFIGRVRAEAETTEPVDELPGFDRPGIERIAHRFVIFTPGHTITGDAHLYRETPIPEFLESTDPPFVAITNARARSLADRRADRSPISSFDLLLVNRKQMIAAAEADRAAAVAD
jgi:hypothetical protein